MFDLPSGIKESHLAASGSRGRKKADFAEGCRASSASLRRRLRVFGTLMRPRPHCVDSRQQRP
jgi:hypothetical protein